MNSGALLRLIAVFKLFKALTLIAVGIAVLRLVHTGQAAILNHWVSRIGLIPGARYMDRAVEKIASLPPHTLRDLGFGSFVYAALFLTEGTGLWLRKRWGEWFTVIITGSLVPVEVYEIIRHPTAGKVLLMLINIAVVVYLVRSIGRGPAPRRIASTSL